MLKYVLNEFQKSSHQCRPLYSEQTSTSSQCCQPLYNIWTWAVVNSNSSPMKNSTAASCKHHFSSQCVVWSQLLLLFNLSAQSIACIAVVLSELACLLINDGNKKSLKTHSTHRRMTENTWGIIFPWWKACIISFNPAYNSKKPSCHCRKYKSVWNIPDSFLKE